MLGKLAGATATALFTAGLTIYATGGAGASTRSGEEYFALTQAGGAISTVITHGLFTDYGKSTDNGQYDSLQLSVGTFNLNHPDSHYSTYLNPATCRFTSRVTGSYTLSGGTNAYKTLTGSGTYVGNGEGILPRNASGQCNSNGAPLAGTFILTAHGPASLGGYGS